MAVIGNWFSLDFKLSFEGNAWLLSVREGRIEDIVHRPRFDRPARFTISAPMRVWTKFIRPDPEPLYHDFFAMLMRGAGLRARRRFPRRDAECACAAPHDEHSQDDGAARWPILSRWSAAISIWTAAGGATGSISRKRGKGRPLICLHTAGADSRQFRHVLNDAEITGRFRVLAFDLPFHGRSNPPDEWWLEKYRLTTDVYLGLIRDFWRALGLERPVVMGCSMGGAIVLKVARRPSGRDYRHRRARKHRLRRGARQRLPAPSGDPWRRARGLLHLRAQRPGFAGGRLPRELVVLQPVGPGRLQGRRLVLLRGLGRARGHRADRHTDRCKVSLLTGEYDYSATPEMTRAVAEAIPGCRFTVMKGIGAFPDGRELRAVPRLPARRAGVDGLAQRGNLDANFGRVSSGDRVRFPGKPGASTGWKADRRRSPGVDNFDPGVAELARIPRHNGKPARGGSGRDKGIRGHGRRAARRAGACPP